MHQPHISDPASHPTFTPATPLTNFVAELERLHDIEQDPQRLITGVQGYLTALLAEPALLTADQREPWRDRYRPHLLAVAPSRRFSVVALVWLPGQKTPIHDHICWCVVGVYEGIERERRFSLREDAQGNRWLLPLTDERVFPGQTSALVPPEENIHQVRNAGTDLAISIHVYGADLSAHPSGLPSSVNQCFDDVPIRANAWEGRPVAWRHI